MGHYKGAKSGTLFTEGLLRGGVVDTGGGMSVILRKGAGLFLK